ncbi:MAG: hypothetical protein ACRCUF_16755, partial [Aeromonas sobria]
ELKKNTPFTWECIELLTSPDGARIAQFEKELHAMTTPATFPESFKGSTEWRLWDDRVPEWYRERQARAA